MHYCADHAKIGEEAAVSPSECGWATHADPGPAGTSLSGTRYATGLVRPERLRGHGQRLWVWLLLRSHDQKTSKEPGENPQVDLLARMWKMKGMPVINPYLRRAFLPDKALQQIVVMTGAHERAKYDQEVLADIGKAGLFVPATAL